MKRMKRRLRGATDDLYKAGSDAAHLAIQQLREVLSDVGFKAVKKLPAETTLRVYPLKCFRYPLLNPRFQPTAADLDESLDYECLIFSVFSKDDDDDLDRHLQDFASTDRCRFFNVGQPGDPYFRHGYFILPVTFTGVLGNLEIDFRSLMEPLDDMLQHLRLSP